MNSEESNELRRLTDMLRIIDTDLEPTSINREALKKAGLALHLAFINGSTSWRSVVPRLYNPHLVIHVRPR
jgi:hypothetical protein